MNTNAPPSLLLPFLILGAILFILVPLPIIVGYLKRNDPYVETSILLLGGGCWTGAALASFFAVATIHYDSIPGFLEILEGLAILILLASPVLGIVDRIKRTNKFPRLAWFLVGGGAEMLFVWVILWNVYFF